VVTPKPSDKLERARAWCAREFRKRYTGTEHGSFLAETLLNEASKLFDLGDCGVEGWSSLSGDTGVQYLNYGDPYIPTIYVRTTATGARWFYGKSGWGPMAGG
jgi:hypothetical protein